MHPDNEAIIESIRKLTAGPQSAAAQQRVIAAALALAAEMRRNCRHDLDAKQALIILRDAVSVCLVAMVPEYEGALPL